MKTPTVAVFLQVLAPKLQTYAYMTFLLTISECMLYS